MRDPKNYYSKRFRPLKVLFFAVMAVLFLVVMGGVIMLLWNAILPDLTGVKPIRFWQAIGLLILSRILFGGFRPGQYKNRMRQKGGRYWKEKWMGMSEEDRLKFKSKWKERCEKRKGQ